MTLTTVRYPVAPTVVQRKGTLLDAATIGSEWANLSENDLFDSYNCMTFQQAANFCAANTKTFPNTASYQDGIKFAAYGGLQCKPVGLDMQRFESEMRRVFEAGESTAVEKALMAQRFVADTVPNGSRWEAPVDITPASGAVKPGTAVALLEGYAASKYVGMPTLHLPVTVASMLLGVEGAAFEGNVLQSKLGSKIAAGAGYDFPNTGPTGAAAAVGEKWAYATGEVYVTRSESIVRTAVDTTNNDVFGLAERGYIVAVDCFTAAIRVSLTA